MSVTIFARAKVNLWLRIFPPDATGYHPLDTLFCAIDLADEIRIELGGSGIHLDVSGADVGPVENNLVFRAARDFYATTGLAPNVAIQLIKNIPAGGGMAGGSSDAAAVLNSLNELHGGVLPDADLMAMGARLGSDVAFFLCGSSLAHATGRGEVLQALPPLPPAPLILIIPNFAVATPDAFRWLDEARAYSRPNDDVMPSIQTWDDVSRHAENDFEAVLFAKFPELDRLRQLLHATGAHIAMVSGSGSALFGVYKNVDERDRAYGSLSSRAADARIISSSTAL